MPDGIEPVVQATGAAGLMGAAARVLISLRDGERRWAVLALDAGVGCTLGIIVAAGLIYFDVSLRADDWLMLIICGGSGLAGALGPRLLDLVVDVLKRRLGA